jgi:hypothetical protein
VCLGNYGRGVLQIHADAKFAVMRGVCGVSCGGQICWGVELDSGFRDMLGYFLLGNGHKKRGKLVAFFELSVRVTINVC